MVLVDCGALVAAAIIVVGVDVTADLMIFVVKVCCMLVRRRHQRPCEPPAPRFSQQTNAKNRSYAVWLRALLQVGAMERHRTGEHILWTIIPEPPHGKDPRTLLTLSLRGTHLLVIVGAG